MKKQKFIYTWSMLLCMALGFISCSDDENASEQIDLVGGCWVCAQNGYSDMLEFATDGTVTSNGVQGDQTWGLEGTYQFAGNTLAMDFGSEKREGNVSVTGDDSFVYTDATGAKNYDRRYPPTFDEALGWEWNWANTLIIKQTLKDELVTEEKTYSVDEWLQGVELVMEKFFGKAQFTESELILANVGIRATSVASFAYQRRGEDIVIISFGLPGQTIQAAAQVKFFANGKMALYFVNDQCYKFLGFITGLMGADQEYDELAKAIADTFSQLVLCISFDRAE